MYAFNECHSLPCNRKTYSFPNDFLLNFFLFGGRTMITEAFKCGGALIGGVYLGDMIWKGAQQEDSRIQKVTRPIVSKLEAIPLRYQLIGIPILTIVAHGLVAEVLDKLGSRKGLYKPLVALETALGVYDLSVPFLLSTSMMVHSRSELSGDSVLVFQLFWHLVKSFSRELLGESYETIVELFEAAQKGKAMLQAAQDVMEKEKRDLAAAIDLVFGFEKGEDLEKVLSNAQAFSVDLKQWNDKIKEHEAKLHDYVAIAHAQRDSLKECNYEALEEMARTLDTVDEKERENVAFIYRTFFDMEDCFEEIQVRLQELKRLREEVDQLFLRAEHLLEGVSVIAYMNDAETLAFISWEVTARDMELGFGSQVMTNMTDILSPSPKRIDRNAVGKAAVLRGIADESSFFATSKRKELQRKAPVAWGQFTEILESMHRLRNAAREELELVHRAQMGINVQKPFFSGVKGEMSQVLTQLQKVEGAFSQLRLSEGERAGQQEREVRLLSLADQIVSPLKDSPLPFLLRFFKGQ